MIIGGQYETQIWTDLWREAWHFAVFLGACEITAPEIDGGKRKRKEKSAETTKQKRKRRKERKCEGKPREELGKRKRAFFTRATI